MEEDMAISISHLKGTGQSAQNISSPISVPILVQVPQSVCDIICNTHLQNFFKLFEEL